MMKRLTTFLLAFLLAIAVTVPSWAAPTVVEAAKPEVKKEKPVRLVVCHFGVTEEDVDGNALDGEYDVIVISTNGWSNKKGHGHIRHSVEIDGVNYDDTLVGTYVKGDDLPDAEDVCPANPPEPV